MWRWETPWVRELKKILLREFAGRVVSGSTRGGGISGSHGDRCEGWFSDPHSEIKVWRTQGFRSGVRDWLVLEGYSDTEKQEWRVMRRMQWWIAERQRKYYREMEKSTRRKQGENFTIVIKSKTRRILYLQSKYLAKILVLVTVFWDVTPTTVNCRKKKSSKYHIISYRIVIKKYTKISINPDVTITRLKMEAKALSKKQVNFQKTTRCDVQGTCNHPLPCHKNVTSHVSEFVC